MKKITFLICLLLFIATINAQNNIPIFFKTKMILELTECSRKGVEMISVQEIPRGSKYTIIAAKEDGFVISIWDWFVEEKLQNVSEIKKETSTDNPNQRKYNTINYKVDAFGEIVKRYFYITKFQKENLSIELKKKIDPVVGTLILPIKFRFFPTDFSKDITFSGTGGVKWTLNNKEDLSLAFIGGVGVSSVTIDSSSTDGFQKNSLDLAAVTLLSGVMLQWQMLQVGFFVGADWLAHKNINNWNYQGKPWLGIGLGVALYSDGNNLKKTGKTTQLKNL